MTIEQDLNCPSCKSQIETAYCQHCNQTIFIKSVKTTIVNVRTEQCDIFVGRRNTTYHWGNPFTHLDIPTRARIKVNSISESLRAFEDWLLGIRHKDVEQVRRKWILDNMEKMLKGKKLGCFCKPNPCHGDIYIKLLHEGTLQKYI